MKKSYIVVLALLALAILGVCIYFIMSKSPAQKAEIAGQTEEKSQGVVEVGGVTPVLGTAQDSGSTKVSGPKSLKP